MDIYSVNELLEKYNVKSSISYQRFIRAGIMVQKYRK